MIPQQNASMSNETIVNLAKEGAKLGSRVSFVVSILYAVVGFYAVELFGEGVGLLSLSSELIIWGVLSIFGIIIAIFLFAIVPATIIGILTGTCLGIFTKFAQRKQISKYFFVLLCVFFCMVAVIGIHLLFQIPITLSFDPPSHEFSLGTYETYPFLIGIPSIIYIFTGGWIGQQLYSSEFLKRQGFSGKQYPKFVILASLGAIVLFAGLLIFKPQTQPTGVLSLQDNWQLLESGGQDWRSDAYLQEVEFYPNSRLPYEISATYLSKSKRKEIYSIDINKKGRILNKNTSDASPMRESTKLPIKRDDWKIGSVQAWNMFMQIEDVNLCLKPSETHVSFFMYLHRIASGRLAWDLSIWGCSLVGDDSSYYLDAKTGETIESYFK